jgi:hypothetical protein
MMCDFKGKSQKLPLAGHAENAEKVIKGLEQDVDSSIDFVYERQEFLVQAGG